MLKTKRSNGNVNDKKLLVNFSQVCRDEPSGDASVLPRYILDWQPGCVFWQSYVCQKTQPAWVQINSNKNHTQKNWNNGWSILTGNRQIQRGKWSFSQRWKLFGRSIWSLEWLQSHFAVSTDVTCACTMLHFQWGGNLATFYSALFSLCWQLNVIHNLQALFNSGDGEFD